MSKGLFFNKIGVADMERVHSAVIGWMLSDECEAFDIQIRSRILNSIFEYNDPNRHYIKIQALIEWKDIDILLLTEDMQGNKDCWIIENKIKTSQHSNQLKRYEGIIDRDYPNICNHFAFLTLIGETALSGDNKWINVTYQRLVSLLEEYLQEKTNNADAVILNEYYLSIQQLSNAASRFIANPQSYTNVFTDGWKSKEQKIAEADKYTDEVSKFIGMNNLETIFQKMYFAQVLQTVREKSTTNFESWHVGETRGNADFAIHLQSENDFNFDISFQAGTFKFAVSRFYWSDTSKANLSKVLSWEEEFRKLQAKYSEYKRLNRAKSRARISISKNLRTEQKEWYLMDNKTFTELVQKEFEQAESMRQSVITFHREHNSY